MNTWIKRILLTIVGVIGVTIILFFIWTQFTYKPSSEVFSYIVGEENGDLTFGDAKADVGFIFYQGGKVEKEAYAYLGSALAEKGYFVVIPQLPFDLAILGSNKAEELINTYTDVKNWYIGGHSLGGVAASSFAMKNPRDIEGIVFLASYPISDMSDSDLRTLSIFGEIDAVAPLDDMLSKNNLLPVENNVVHIIEAGNHSNFGMYGLQKGDNPTDLSAREQLDVVTTLIDTWIKQAK
ncbi:alpha/beta hydrolase [Bacillus sp. HMF5848]|uniref:alpha/beta hydrolase n=1 Tax=Bacillus sp. HMF5848 TaxID=2495421 RepID=UPI000F781B46|nr:alpha/beta hydrolase [Bacillus sp. HMF5848]RSK25971.1 alpha/beta hydrolase [Bacillus sp. HMF5848]